MIEQALGAYPWCATSACWAGPAIVHSTRIDPMASLTNCPACQKRISTSASACPNCGHPTSRYPESTAAVDYAGVPVAGPANETMALASMICGVGCVVLAFTPFASWLTGLLAAVATILSIVALAKIKRRMATGLGMAITGLVCGVIGLLIFALAIIGVFLLGVGNG